MKLKYMNPIPGSLTLHESYGFSWPFIDQNPDNADRLKKHVLDQDQRSNSLLSSQLMMYPLHNMLERSMKLPAAAVEQHPGNRLLPLLPPTNIEEVVKSKRDGSCKLFGISLIGNHVATETTSVHENIMHRPQRQIVLSPGQLQALVSNLQFQQVESPKSAEIAIRDDEWGKPFQALEQLSRNVQGSLQSNSTRTCIKVFSYPFKCH